MAQQVTRLHFMLSWTRTSGCPGLFSPSWQPQLTLHRHPTSVSTGIPSQVLPCGACAVLNPTCLLLGVYWMQVFGAFRAALRRMEMGCRDELGWGCTEEG